MHCHILSQFHKGKANERITFCLSKVLLMNFASTLEAIAIRLEAIAMSYC